MNRATKEQNTEFRQKGYVVVRDAVPGEIIQSVSEAVNKIVDRAVAGEFTDPPFKWLDEAARIPYWMNDLLTPRKYYPAFGEFLDTIISPFIESLLGAPVRCSWFSMLTCGSGIPYTTPVHRDNSKLGSEDELETLENFDMQQCYIQAPILANDHFLQMIPGSNSRAATPEEIGAQEAGWEGES
ncbi:MAG: hypothetical protein HKN25_16205, partial [Pyrinomonadaceae bacterium]|nr:hypothetical protein [Pyrinomonadaceae bacterium]